MIKKMPPPYLWPALFQLLFIILINLMIYFSVGSFVKQSIKSRAEVMRQSRLKRQKAAIEEKQQLDEAQRQVGELNAVYQSLTAPLILPSGQVKAMDSLLELAKQNQWLVLQWTQSPTQTATLYEAFRLQLDALCDEKAIPLFLKALRTWRYAVNIDRISIKPYAGKETEGLLSVQINFILYQVKKDEKG